MKAYIKAISYYLPEKILTNEDLLRDFPEWTVAKVAKKIGINQRHISAADECASDMAVKAAEQLFIEYGIDKESIDFIILCTQSPDYFLPSSACIIQNRLGLKTSCGAFDFNLGCSGFVYGLSLAKGMIFGGIAKNILLLTAETYTKHLHPKDKSDRAIFGDAAAATLISTEGFAEIGNFSLGTDGSGAENLIIKTGGCRTPKPQNDLYFNESNNPISSDFLYMNGPEIFNFTIDTVPSLIGDTLQRNQLEQKDIKMFILHQANRYILDYLRLSMDIEESHFYYYMSEVGNTVSSTLPIAIKEAIKSDLLYGNVLIAGFGVGYSWGGNVLNFT